MKREALTLFQLNSHIKKGVEELFPFPLWIVAEISEMSVRNHCYLTLVQKDEDSDAIISKARATIWAYTFNMLKPYFETTTGYGLEAGIRVLLNVEVNYSELYGLSLNVRDIDPTFTLGDIERRRMEILRELEKEGIWEMNKTLQFPHLPKNIAIISSPKSAGYQDFMKQIETNADGFKFHLKLFPATMQGNQATDSIMKALEKIYAYETVFDVVVLIRGGGATADLACFDSYELAVNLAQFPLPILTGIGHDKDVSIADKVAHISLKTPTAVAVFLIECLMKSADEIKMFSLRCVDAITDRIEDEKYRVKSCQTVFKYKLPQRIQAERYLLMTKGKRFQKVVEDKLVQVEKKHSAIELGIAYQIAGYSNDNKLKVRHLEERMRYALAQKQNKERLRIENKEKQTQLLAPENLLRRGYSITTHNGRLVKDISEIREGQILKTKIYNGAILSKVAKKETE